jgi:hypothetical protein
VWYESVAMAVPIEDVLALWREAERLLEALPDESAERVAVHAEAAHLRELYRSLSAQATMTGPTLASSTEAIERSRRLLERVKARLDVPPAAG